MAAFDFDVVGTSNFNPRHEYTQIHFHHDSLSERNHSIQEARLEQFRRLGACIRSCCCSGKDVWCESLLYWPATVALKAPRFNSKPVSRLDGRIPSGFMSQHRGLSWDSRSRRGRK